MIKTTDNLRCLETRRHKDGTKRRRYRTADGRTFVTVEVPLTVFKNAINPKRFEERMASWQRGEALRTRRKRVMDLIAAGVKPLAIGEEVGLSARQVQAVRYKAGLRA